MAINPCEAPYGAIGDGVNDDTSPLQSAIDACVRERQTLSIPAARTYKITYMLNAAPQKGSQQRLHIRTEGGKLLWAGPPNSTMLRAIGWKNSIVEGLHWDTGNISGVTCCDLDTPDNAPSTSGITFADCQINFGSGGGCVGWRGSVNGNLYGDVSALLFQNCMVRGLSRTNGDIGWQGLRRNNLGWTWQGGGASRLKHIFSNHNPDDGAQHGGGSHSFYGMVATENECDFDFHAAGVFLVSGGRFETGKRLLQIGAGGTSFAAAARVSGVTIASYTPDDGAVFFLGTAASLAIEDCSINRFGAADYDTRLITVNPYKAAYGSIRISGGGIQRAQGDWFTPLDPLNPGHWDVSVTGVSQISAASGAVGWLTA